MPGNGLFSEKSNDGLIWPARREEDLGGGRASWLVSFGVISRNTNKPPATRKREKNMEEVGKTSPPPPKGSPSPPPESNEKRKEKRLRKRERD